MSDVQRQKMRRIIKTFFHNNLKVQSDMCKPQHLFTDNLVVRAVQGQERVARHEAVVRRGRHHQLEGRLTPRELEAHVLGERDRTRGRESDLARQTERLDLALVPTTRPHHCNIQPHLAICVTWSFFCNIFVQLHKTGV